MGRKLSPSQAKENRHDKKQLRQLHYQRKGNGFNLQLIGKSNVRFFNLSLVGRPQTTARNFWVTLDKDMLLEEIMERLRNAFKDIV